MNEINTNEEKCNGIADNDVSFVKRPIGVLDPDYMTVPDAKKLKSLEEKGEEELCERVVKIIKKEFNQEIDTCQSQLEEIDQKILKSQQYLHTLRYLGALQYYAFDKVKGKRYQRSSPKKLLQENHPVICKSLEKPNFDAEPIPESISEPASTQQNGDNSKQEIEESSRSECCPNEALSVEKLSSYCIPTLPESKEVIAQGRKGRFQNKIRIVVGNTYQYLQNSDDVNPQLKFKWRVYVRGPPQNSSEIANYISSVTYTLDKSYSPHDVITISEPPFTLSRRGWGEFKIKLELRFRDPRNKPVQLLHNLRLSRTDDPLALTGIWRLGEETWYDVWLYCKEKEMCSEENTLTVAPKRDHTETLIESLSSKGIITKTVYEDDVGNVTLSHDTIKKEPIVKTLPDVKLVNGVATKPEVTKIKTTVIKMKDLLNNRNKQTAHSIETSIMNSLNTSNNLVSPTIKSSSSPQISVAPKTPIIKSENSLPLKQNDEKTNRRIILRQADGKLVYKTVSEELYQMAVQLSDKNGTKLVKKSNDLKPVKPFVSNGVSEVDKSSPNHVNADPKKSVKVRTNIISMNPTVLRNSKESIPKLVPANSTLPLQSPSSNFKFQFPLVESSSNPSAARISSHPTKVYRTLDGNKFVLTKSSVPTKPEISNMTLPTSQNITKIVPMPNGKKVIYKTPPANMKLLNTSSYTNNLSLVQKRTFLDLKTNTFTLNNKVSKNGPSVVGDLNMRKMFIKTAPKFEVKITDRNSSLNTSAVLSSHSKGKFKNHKKFINTSPKEENLSEKFIERLRQVKKQCETLKTSEAVMRVFLKMIPLFGDESLFWEFSQLFCASSRHHFEMLPYGRQKAAEIWRAREILKTIKDLKISGYEILNIRRIVQWSQKHGYSGSFKILSKSAIMKASRDVRFPASCSLSMAEDVKSPTKILTSKLEEDLIVDVESDGPVLIKQEKDSITSDVQTISEDSIALLSADANNGCHYVNSVLSRTRVKLFPEEICNGVKMDVAKNVMWTATLSFMEDLLRCSAAASLEEGALQDITSNSSSDSKVNVKIKSEKLSQPKESIGAPLDVKAKHVAMGLNKGRDEFDLITQRGLAKKVPHNKVLNVQTN